MSGEATTTASSARSWVALALLAVLGGWLLVMPGSVVALSLRFNELDRGASATAYSLALGAGWLVLVSALVAFGRLSDRLRSRGASRARILVAAVPVAVLCAVAVLGADTVAALTVVWVVAQAVAAAIVAPALALVGDIIPVHRRGWASAVAGALSTLALLIGVLLVRVVDLDTATALAASLLLGAALTLPLMLRRGTPPMVMQAPSSAQAPRRNGRAWAAFVGATLLAAWCISTANSYVVLFIDRVSTVADGAVASTATSLVAIATVMALLGTAVGGVASRNRRSSIVAYALACVGLAGAVVVMVALPTPAGLLSGSLMLGLAAGVFGGAQLAVALFVRTSDARLGNDLGVLNAAAALPHVLVPAVAALVFTVDVAAGLRWMFVGSGLLALIAGAMMLPLARQPRLQGQVITVRGSATSGPSR